MSGLIPGEEFILSDRSSGYQVTLIDGTRLMTDFTASSPDSHQTLFVDPNATVSFTWLPDFLMGDFDSSGVVNAADYTVFRDTYGYTVVCRNRRRCQF